MCQRDNTWISSREDFAASPVVKRSRSCLPRCTKTSVDPVTEDRLEGSDCYISSFLSGLGPARAFHFGPIARKLPTLAEKKKKKERRSQKTVSPRNFARHDLQHKAHCLNGFITLVFSHFYLCDRTRIEWTASSVNNQHVPQNSKSASSRSTFFFFSAISVMTPSNFGA